MMPGTSKLPDTLDLSRLAKVWALAERGTAGEAAAARAQARKMVQKHGKSLADIPGLLRAAAPAPAAAVRNPFEGFEEWMEKKEPGYIARRAAERAERKRQEQAELAALITRYGSLDAILEPTAAEATLRAAVLPWCEFESDDTAEWVQAVDGCSQVYGQDKMTARVRKALSEALPLPDTLAAALAEHRAWDARNRELDLAYGPIGDIRLDLPSWYRWEIVRELLESGLRATSIEDALIRQQHYCDGDVDRPEIREAVLLDLKHLAELATRNGVQSGQTVSSSPVEMGVPPKTGTPPTEWTTATARRNRIREMLSNVDGAGLSDREIARRVGVSPQTVGNIRRSMAGGQEEMFVA